MSTLDFSVMPLSRVVPKTKYREVSAEINILSSEIMKAEILSVSEGLRPCSTYHIKSESVMEDLEFLNSLGLLFLPLRKCKRVGGFAHRFYEPSPGEPYDVYGVISRSLEDAKKWKAANNSSPTDNRTIGELLNYPKCCIEFFERAWRQGHYDPIWDAALNSNIERIDEFTVKVIDPIPETNIIPRYFGLRAIPQLVCSFHCEESKEFAKDFLRFIPHRKELMEFLKDFYIWDCYKGVAIVTHEKFIGLANSMTYQDRHIVYMGDK